MIVVGRGEPPQWVPVPADRVERARARLALIGLPVAGAALVLGIVLVAVGLNLLTARSPLNVIGVMTAGIAAFFAMLSGASVLSARSCVRDGYVDVNGSRLVRRLLGVWWGAAIFCVLGAWFAEVMTLRGDVPFGAGSAVYLALLALVLVLGGLAFFAASNILRRLCV